MRHGHIKSGGRYPVLRAIAILYLILAVPVALGGLGVAFYTLFWGWGGWHGPINDRLLMCGYALVGTFVGVLTMLALSEGIKLFMDIEHHTRQMAHGGAGPAPVASDGTTLGNRGTSIVEEETAEGALLRGH